MNDLEIFCVAFGTNITVLPKPFDVANMVTVETLCYAKYDTYTRREQCLTNFPEPGAAVGA